MTKSACMLIGKPSAIFQTIIDVIPPLSMGPIEVTFLLLFVVTIFFGVVYSKRVRIFTSYWVGQRIG